jgi:hypothetical protein
MDLHRTWKAKLSDGEGQAAIERIGLSTRFRERVHGVVRSKPLSR